jgi:hypothetical protein
VWPIQELLSRFSSTHFLSKKLIGLFYLSFLHPSKFVADRRFGNTGLGVPFFRQRFTLQYSLICCSFFFQIVVSCGVTPCKRLRDFTVLQFTRIQLAQSTFKLLFAAVTPGSVVTQVGLGFGFRGKDITTLLC